MTDEKTRRQSTLYRYSFGTAEFDEAAFTLRVAGEPVEVQRKPLEILALLLHHSGEVVTREELLDTLWAGTTTVDAVVSTAINRLRAALGSENAGRVVNQPRIGYRFDGPFERMAVGRSLVSALKLEPGQKVPGRPNFELVRLIGRSEGSEVWTARQVKTGEIRVYKFSPDGERLAALKREAMLSRYLRGRLGTRDDIVRILDWNFETPPFFLECEYGGENLIEWAEPEDRLRSMPLAARLDLFLQIADVVAAAHDVAVLHKDLKPGNILVAAGPQGWQVRLTDFGSGRLLEPDRLAEMGITQLGLSMTQGLGASSSGTPLYLAPELIAGQAPTQRSDVYALGLILYQLVVGDFARPLASGWDREIADPLLREDIAQATDIDPAQRPDSAAALARRLRALDERRREQALRFAAEGEARTAAETIKRNRARRPWIVATMAVLGVGLVASLGLYLQVRTSERDLAAQFNVARTLQRFFTEDFIAVAKPTRAGRADMTVAEAAKSAAGQIDEAFKSDPPTVRAALHVEMARSFYELSDFDAAYAEGQKAIAAAQSEGEPDSRVLADAQIVTAGALIVLTKRSEAQDLLDGAERTLDHSVLTDSTLRELRVGLWIGRSWLAETSRDIPETMRTAKKCWDLVQRLPDISPVRRDNCELLLADGYRFSGKLDESAAAYRDVLARQTERFGEADPRPAHVAIGLAALLLHHGQADQAKEILLSSVASLKKALGPDNYMTITATSYLAEADFYLKQYEDALALWREAAAGNGRAAGESSESYLDNATSVGMALHELGRVQEAAAQFRDTLDKSRENLAPNDPMVQGIRYYLADSLLDLHDDHEVPALLDGLTPEALNSYEQSPDWEGRLAYQTGRLALLQGDRHAALAALTKAADIINEKNPNGAITPEMLQASIAEASRGTRY
jgi:serine/threonine protein kinase